MRILVKTADIFGIIELYFPSFELLCESCQTTMAYFDTVLCWRFFYHI